MGELVGATNIKNLVKKYNLTNFVETGSGSGHSMNQSFEFDFVNRYGIELNENLCEKLKETFDNKVSFFNGYSHEQLPFVMNILSEQPTLFWLDAHFPDSDYFHVPYDSEKDPVKRIPLESEIDIICKSRNTKNDVFLVDDLRVYVDRSQLGAWALRKTAGGDGYQFIIDRLNETHNITEIYKHQGYLVITPKE